MYGFFEEHGPQAEDRVMMTQNTASSSTTRKTVTQALASVVGRTNATGCGQHLHVQQKYIIESFISKQMSSLPLMRLELVLFPCSVLTQCKQAVSTKWWTSFPE